MNRSKHFLPLLLFLLAGLVKTVSTLGFSDVGLVQSLFVDQDGTLYLSFADVEMVSGFAEWIGLVVRGWEVVPLYCKGSFLQRGPHPTRLRRPTFPPGEGSGQRCSILIVCFIC